MMTTTGARGGDHARRGRGRLCLGGLADHARVQRQDSVLALLPTPLRDALMGDARCCPPHGGGYLGALCVVANQADLLTPSEIEAKTSACPLARARARAPRLVTRTLRAS